MRLKLILILLYLNNIVGKRKGKKYRDMSSESIENILYYKDCNHKLKATAAPVMRAPPIQQCKMFCTMCCGDQCVDSQQMSLGRQNQGFDPKIPPIIQPDVKERRKKIKPLLQPIPERRSVAFTRENIKNLIAKDEDIRKILKDLVRVTMQKVDLMQLVNARQNLVKGNPDISDESESDNVQ